MPLIAVATIGLDAAIASITASDVPSDNEENATTSAKERRVVNILTVAEQTDLLRQGQRSNTFRKLLATFSLSCDNQFEVRKLL